MRLHYISVFAALSILAVQGFRVDDAEEAGGAPPHSRLSVKKEEKRAKKVEATNQSNEEDPDECVDTNIECKHWKEDGQCNQTDQSIMAKMAKTCPYTCELCQKAGEEPAEEETTTTTTEANETTTTLGKVEAAQLRVKNAMEVATNVNERAKRMAHRASDQKQYLAESQIKEKKADEAVTLSRKEAAEAAVAFEQTDLKATMLKQEWMTFKERLDKATEEKEAAAKLYHETRTESVRAETIKEKYVAEATMSQEIAANWTLKKQAAKAEVDRNEHLEAEANQVDKDKKAELKMATDKMKEAVKAEKDADEAVVVAEAETLKATEWNQRLADRAVSMETLFAATKGEAIKAGKTAQTMAAIEEIATHGNKALEAQQATTKHGEFADKAKQDLQQAFQAADKLQGSSGQHGAQQAPQAAPQQR